MEKITRRTALMGTAAAVAVTATAAAAPAFVSDPHIAWLEKSRRTISEAGALFKKSGAIEDELRRTTDAYAVTELLDPYRQRKIFVESVSQIESVRDQALSDIWIGSPDMIAEKKARKTANYDKMVSDFTRRKALRKELEDSTGITDLNRRAFALMDQERKLDFLITDTPATTLEGAYVQAIILHKWLHDGTPRRDPENVQLTTDEQELLNLSSRVTSTLAALVGKDTNIGFSRYQKLETFEGGKIKASRAALS